MLSPKSQGSRDSPSLSPESSSVPQDEIEVRETQDEANYPVLESREPQESGKSESAQYPALEPRESQGSGKSLIKPRDSQSAQSPIASQSSPKSSKSSKSSSVDQIGWPGKTLIVVTLILSVFDFVTDHLLLMEVIEHECIFVVLVYWVSMGFLWLYVLLALVSASGEWHPILNFLQFICFRKSLQQIHESFSRVRAKKSVIIQAFLIDCPQIAVAVAPSFVDYYNQKSTFNFGEALEDLEFLKLVVGVLSFIFGVGLTVWNMNQKKQRRMKSHAKRVCFYGVRAVLAVLSFVFAVTYVVLLCYLGIYVCGSDVPSFQALLNWSRNLPTTDEFGPEV